MSTTPEGKVKKWLKKEVNDRYPESWCYMPPGGPFGQIGVADFMWVIKAGRFNVVVVIEVKSDEYMIPTVPQVRFLKNMMGLNCVSALMKGKDKERLVSIYKAIDTKVSFFKSLSEKLNDIPESEFGNLNISVEHI